MSGPAPLWVPGPAELEDSDVVAFDRWTAERHGRSRSDYAGLWEWSVTEPGEFWADVAAWFDVPFRTGATTALADRSMPGASWFPGAALNYVDQVFHGDRGSGVAVMGFDQRGGRHDLRWPELHRQVAALAATLREHGVCAGDRVVGFLPDVPQAVVGFLATAAIGAVWAACGQEYPAGAARDRLAQLDPVVLVAADGHHHGPGTSDLRSEVAELRAGLPTVRTVLSVPVLGLGLPDALPWADATAGEVELQTEPVAFDHPLWVLFSSGTTGAPKGIVHGHGGIVLEHLKHHAFHLDLGDADVFCWATSPSWTMWNMRTSGLLLGATVVCFDGNVVHPGPDTFWHLAAQARVTVLGASPALLARCRLAGVVPRRPGTEGLRVLGVTGSVPPASDHEWISTALGGDVQVTSTSGGTDVCSAFAGGARTVPVWAGEMSVRCLGVPLAAVDGSHRAVVDEVGELVVTGPVPSMPMSFWADPDGSRLRSAYFEDVPGAWRHGDWVTVTDRGSVVVHGRSDATLNRNGIRMGSADVYTALADVDEVLDCLVLGVEGADGSYWMPLFVQLAPGAVLDGDLRDRIVLAVRQRASPRHVPDDVLVVPGIPHTRTGKKLEVPLKLLFQTGSAGSLDRGVVDRPELLDWFEGCARERTADVAR